MPKRPPKECFFRKRLSPMGESLRIVVPYVVLGGLWILLTDSLLNFAPDTQDMMRISVIKGLLYVAITTLLLWTLVYSRVKQVRAGQEALADSEARFRLLVESAPDAVFVHADGCFIYVNARAVSLFGAKTEEELLGQPVSDLVAGETEGDWADRSQKADETAAAPPVSSGAVRRIGGGRLEVELSAVTVQFGGKDCELVFMRDITGRRQYERNRLRVEQQLREKHRLESIGTLAGGIAHEINNPISGIINYAQLISDRPGADAQLQEYSGEIMHEGQRIADTVKNLLSFAQGNKQAHELVSAGEIVEQTVSLAELVTRQDQITLTVRVAEDLPEIRCSAQQIRQMLLNLITNARSALNARYSGYDENKTLRVSAEAIERGGQPWVRFTVEDRGVGIREDLLPRVFDPFFTTSMRSEHAGLGLSICLGIVREHRGDIRFESHPGEYTRAIVELPVEESALV